MLKQLTPKTQPTPPCQRCPHKGNNGYKVISEKWQVIVEFMNLGKREGEQLRKVEAITHPDYHHSRIGYNAPVTAHRNGSTPRAQVNTQAVSPSPYPPTPANDSAPKNLLTPSAAVQQRWGIQGNTLVSLNKTQKANHF